MDVKVTVNGQDAREYAREQESKEKSREIQEFLRFELRSMSRVGHRHIMSARPAANVSKPVDVGNGSIRCR